jgi:hypothetical protein
MGKPTNPIQPRVKGKFAAKPKDQPATTYDLLCEVSGRIIAMEARIMERINLMHNKVITETNAIDETVDRIEGYLNKVGQAVVDQGREFKSRLSRIETSVAVIRAGASFMQQLEKDAMVDMEAKRKEAQRADKLSKLKWLTPVMTPDGEGAVLSDGGYGASVSIKEGGDVLWYHIDDIQIL